MEAPAHKICRFRVSNVFCIAISFSQPPCSLHKERKRTPSLLHLSRHRRHISTFFKGWLVVGAHFCVIDEPHSATKIDIFASPPLASPPHSRPHKTHGEHGPRSPPLGKGKKRRNHKGRQKFAPKSTTRHKRPPSSCIISPSDLPPLLVPPSSCDKSVVGSATAAEAQSRRGEAQNKMQARSQPTRNGRQRRRSIMRRRGGCPSLVARKRP